MKASSNCIAVIKHYERFYAQPYLCPASVSTIGYGTTVYPEGKKVRLSDAAITEADATELLLHDVAKFESGVNSLLKVPVTQSMFDALVSFTYNLGAGSLAESTLLKIINANTVADSANWKKIITIEFCKWVKATVNGKRIALAGLVARRSTEAYLFCDNQIKFFN